MAKRGLIFYLLFILIFCFCAPAQVEELYNRTADPETKIKAPELVADPEIAGKVDETVAVPEAESKMLVQAVEPQTDSKTTEKAACLEPEGKSPEPSTDPETESKIPELAEFHKVIYLIWHEAYPVKDYAALRSYVPDIHTLAQKLYDARLPGILRDKETKWKEGIAEFKNSVNAYFAAAKGTDNEALLDAAEDLHSRFETLVRIIRPVLREVDDFHRVLYVIYHKYLPKKEYEKIKASSEELTSKAEAITEATLPKKLQPKTEAFNAAANALYEASKKLEETCRSGQGDAIERGVHEVHTKYQNLERIFE